MKFAPLMAMIYQSVHVSQMCT